MVICIEILAQGFDRLVAQILVQVVSVDFLAVINFNSFLRVDDIPCRALAGILDDIQPKLIYGIFGGDVACQIPATLTEKLR